MLSVCSPQSITHTGDTWANADTDRLSLFTCYDTVNSKWGKDQTAPAVVDSFPPLRRTLFRGVWAEGSNTYYDGANSSSIWEPGLGPTYNPAATGTSVRQTKEDGEKKAEQAAKKQAALAKLARL